MSKTAGSSESVRNPAILKIKVSPRGASRLKDGHVWVYRSDIVSSDGASPCSLATVVDSLAKPLRTALYSSPTQLPIPLNSHDPVDDFPALLRQRIAAAIAYRQ